MKKKILSCAAAVLFCHDLLFLAVPGFAQDVILVNFGSTAAENQFGLLQWNTVVKSADTDYTSTVPDGLAMISGTDEYDGFYGVTGPARSFSEGERIAVTWYNKGTSSIYFNPIVSFTDTDNPLDTAGEPQWYPMSETDGIYSYDITIPSGASLVTIYDITDSAVAGDSIEASAGNRTVVNISPGTVSQNLICDKIELTEADKVAPTQPQNFEIDAVSANSVTVSWDESTDNTSVRKYKIYLDGRYQGNSTTTSYTIYNLLPATAYAISATAIDGFFNESPQCPTLNATTESLPANSALIDPRTAIEYKGAFRFPSDTLNSSWAYRSGDPAYYPRTTGDPSHDDGYPGSLFVGGHLYDKYVAEIAIPEPVISSTKNASELNRAQTIQDFHDVVFPGLNSHSWANGVCLEYIPAQGTQSSDKLYTIYGDNYSISGKKEADHGASDLDLSSPNAQGGWYVGDSTQYSGAPPYNSTFRYLFEIPGTWADEYTGGRLLVTGGNRYGNYPNGPAMHAIGPWIDGSPLPPDKTELSYVTLLQYENNSGTHYLNGQEMSGTDQWGGGAWLTSGDKSAAIITGRKVFGETWYGFSDGTPSNYPHLHVPDPGEWEGHGPKSSMFLSMILFYNPADLEDVANGIKQPYEPQPYAALDISDYAFSSIITETAYDRQRNILYIIENRAYGEASGIVHVFKIHDTSSSLEKVIAYLQILSGIQPIAPFNHYLDINGDAHLGIAEVIKMLGDLGL